MAYRSLSVGPSKGLVLAQLDDVPDLLVIVGPNGSGKSTLLYELQRNRVALAEPGTRVMYLNPSRPWRRTTFGAGYLYNLDYSYRQLTELDTFPGFMNYQPQGFQQSGLPRSPDNVDDAQSLVKFALTKLEAKRQQALAKEYDRRGGTIPSGAIPDAFEPIRELVTNLLPHLRFDHVDMTGSTKLMNVYFEKLDAPEPTQVEIDDLSSGEKAVLQLFMPFIEHRIERLLGEADAQGDEPRAVAIIDEPELHLHPALQVALIAYLRQLTARGEAQFIIATHSTTIMDCLEDEELYLLAPPLSSGSENQLIRLTASAERLDAVRQIAGSTYVVTRCRPIIFVEGESAAGSRDVTDQRLIEMLIPESRGWVVVPSRGRTDAIRGASALREPTLTHLPGMAVFALVDRDQHSESGDDYVITWPVTMVENLLLDIDAIWEVCEPLRERIGLDSPEDVRKVFEDYARNRIEREVSLRLQRAVPRFRIVRDIQSVEDFANLRSDVESATNKFIGEIGQPEEIAELAITLREQVSALVTEGRALDAFHGKEMLRAFYDEWAKKGGWSYQSFCYSVAQAARQRPRLRELVETPVRRIRQYVPDTLVDAINEAVPVLEEGGHGAMAGVAVRVQQARQRWEDGVEDTSSRVEMRSELSTVARLLKQLGHDELQRRVLAGSAALGTD